MAELSLVEVPIDAAPTSVPTPVAAAAAATITDVTPPAEHIAATNTDAAPGLAPKRQRRPSVRLGEIGEQPATISKAWRFHRDPTLAAKSSRTRPITNLVNGGGNVPETLETDDNLEFANRKSKSRRPMKRARTNWTASSKVGNGGFDFRDYEDEGGYVSPLKERPEHSPVHSLENEAHNSWHGQRRKARAPGDQEDETLENDRNCSGELVRNWLIGLGLGRYSSLFEIHEVDDEVLPMLTLEDLKDMGVNAVGSRRKLFIAIQKLRKEIS